MNNRKTNKIVLNGAIHGIPFSKENQPSAQAKKDGWKKLKAMKLLTQSIVKEMVSDSGEPNETFKSYIKSLIENAKNGNAKAIETINNCLEDQIHKQEITFPKLGIDLEEEIYY